MDILNRKLSTKIATAIIYCLLSSARKKKIQYHNRSMAECITELVVLPRLLYRPTNCVYRLITNNIHTQAASPMEATPECVISPTRFVLARALVHWLFRTTSRSDPFEISAISYYVYFHTHSWLKLFPELFLPCTYQPRS